MKGKRPSNRPILCLRDTLHHQLLSHGGSQIYSMGMMWTPIYIKEYRISLSFLTHQRGKHLLGFTKPFQCVRLDLYLLH